MKIYQFKIATLVLILVPFFTYGQYTKTKEIKKHYNVSGSGNLSIDGKYGDVHVETWDKKEVDLVVKISVTKRSEDKAQEYLDKINIRINDGSAEDLSFKTELDGNFNNRSGEKMEIEYRVKVPVGLNMGLENSYGNLYLADTEGDIDIDVAYGNLKIGKVAGPIDFKLSYGNGDVGQVSNGDVVVRYSNLEVGNAGNIDVTNSYSNIDFDNAKDVDLSNKYGNVTWRSLNNLQGYSKYGTVKVDKLYESLIFDVNYGGGLKVGWISKDFNRIDIESSYASVSLRFEQGMSAMLDAELKYCDLKNYNLEFDHSYIDESGSMKSYKGKLGKGNFASKINITSDYGTVKVSYVQ
ncbi:MAG: hypothetical protein ABFS32_04715 [Bacteroidota bacterium]